VFPSAFPAILGGSVENCLSDCPRCYSNAEVVNGYTILINGMVTFIASPNYSLKEKELLIEAATEVGSGRVQPEYAAQRIEATSKEAGRLLREWGALGMTFVSAMAAVASFVLAYTESRGNAPAEVIAVEKFEDVICSQRQPDRRLARPPLAQKRPMARPLIPNPDPKESDRATSGPKPPKENRKARRARIKKERSKAGKR
ncbi:MAG: hypothetical protein ACQEVT_18920, partial [Pseudomonadota bacterium]